MDFLKDQLCTRRWFRVFTLEDLWAREALAIEVDTSLPAVRVIRVLDRIAAVRGYPQYLRVDNGPEFISLALDAWAYRHGVQLVFIDPGRPVQNAHIESFHDKVRDEFLNEHWFATSPRRRSSPKHGASITTPSGRTVRWAIGRPRSTSAITRGARRRCRRLALMRTSHLR